MRIPYSRDGVAEDRGEGYGAEFPNSRRGEVPRVRGGSPPQHAKIRRVRGPRAAGLAGHLVLQFGLTGRGWIV